MSRPSVGRNDPCPCGSGKKYKKCCRRAAPGGGPGLGGIPFESDPDRMSNAALDAIEAGKFEEAEALCARLLEEFPDQIDGHDRLGQLREAQGRFSEAADHYGQVLAMIRNDPHSFEEATRVYFEKRRSRAQRKTGAAPRSAP